MLDEHVAETSMISEDLKTRAESLWSAVNNLAVPAQIYHGHLATLIQFYALTRLLEESLGLRRDSQTLPMPPIENQTYLTVPARLGLRVLALTWLQQKPHAAAKAVNAKVNASTGLDPASATVTFYFPSTVRLCCYST
jgi:hypothetical protein